MVLVGKLVTVKKNIREENGQEVIKYGNVGFIVDEERDEQGKFIPGSGRVLPVLVGKNYKGVKELEKCLNQRFYIVIPLKLKKMKLQCFHI